MGTRFGCAGDNGPCFQALATVDVGPNNNYRIKLKALSSELLATPDGGRMSYRLCIMNDADEPTGPFELIFSPPALLQGTPINRATAYIITITNLAPRETGYFFANDIDYPMPEAAIFQCRDKAFTGN
jgi:hypothetical protein